MRYPVQLDDHEGKCSRRKCMRSVDCHPQYIQLCRFQLVTDFSAIESACLPGCTAPVTNIMSMLT